MKNTRKHGSPASAESIARLAERGEDVSRFGGSPFCDSSSAKTVVSFTCPPPQLQLQPFRSRR